MKYLQKTGQSRADVEEKARKFLREGYARLASFEANGGGFSYYDHSTGMLWISAFGLRQLNEMKPFVRVDPRLLERTEKYIREHIQECVGAQRLFAELVLYEVSQSKTSEVMETVPPERDDIYEEAIQLNLLATKYPKNPEVRARGEKLANKILAGQMSEIKTLTGAYGDYGNKELLGWISTALSLSDGDVTIRSRIFDKLVAGKCHYGGWGTTQATILALRALILESMASVTSGKITVETREGQQEYEIIPTSNPILFSVPTEKETRLNFSGTGRICYTILTKGYERWGKEEATLMRNGLNLQITTDKKIVSLMEPFVVRFSCINTAKEKTQMTILSIGLAPGMMPSLDCLNEWKTSDKIERYEIETGKVVLYLDGVPALDKLVFDLPISGSRPGKYILPQSMLYEYYSPDNIDIAPQETVEIQGKE